MNITIILAIVALVLALVVQFQAQGRDLIAWAVILLSLIHLLPLVIA